MKIALGADHRGIDTARSIAEHLKRHGHTTVVFGPEGDESCDYPEPAYGVARSVAQGNADRGVLICGTGIGVSIAANKVKGVRAAVVHDELTTQLCRSHNDANVVCFSGDLLGQRLMEKLVDVFIRTEFEGGRHARRLGKIAAIERGEDPATVATDA
jgi:ribose 5-phosphate isomerase B